MQKRSLNQNEQGRSMVEMLGVLAVMGLLTIIGIAGFKIAMNKAKANNLVADMNRLAHIVVMDKFSGYSEEAINRAVEEHNQDTEYPATCNSTFKSTMFSLTLKNPIDKEMCEQVANLGWAVPQGVFLNEVEKETLQAEDCADSNTLTWVFMDDLSHCSDCVLADTKCGTYGNECGSCSDLRGFNVDSGKQCTDPTKQYCIRGTCTTCAQNYFDAGNNNCIPCYTDGHSDHISDATKHNCIGIMFHTDDHRMIGCNDPQADRWSGADELGCKACGDIRCYYPNGRTCQRMSALPGRIRNSDGTCGTCKQNYFDAGNNNCISCYTDGHTDWAQESTKHNCLTKMFWSSSGNRMIGCNDTGMANWANSDEYSCKQCDERCYDNGRCRLMGTTYGKDADGNCTTN